MAAEKVHLDVPCPKCNFIADEWFFNDDSTKHHVQCPMCGYDAVVVAQVELAPGK